MMEVKTSQLESLNKSLQYRENTKSNSIVYNLFMKHIQKLSCSKIINGLTMPILQTPQ